MNRLNTLVYILCLVFLFGCQEQTRQETGTEKPAKEPLAKTAVEPAAKTEQSPKTDGPTESSVAEAKQKLAFAENRLSLAQKGIMGYSQTVVLCRDVIKQCPGTEYERKAKELLRKIPEDRRSQYNLTDEELGL